MCSFWRQGGRSAVPVSPPWQRLGLILCIPSLINYYFSFSQLTRKKIKVCTVSHVVVFRAPFPPPLLPSANTHPYEQCLLMRSHSLTLPVQVKTPTKMMKQKNHSQIVVKILEEILASIFAPSTISFIINLMYIGLSWFAFKNHITFHNGTFSSI